MFINTLMQTSSFWRDGVCLAEEEAVQQGVLQNGMGPIAKKLTLQEAGGENTPSPRVTSVGGFVGTNGWILNYRGGLIHQ